MSGHDALDLYAGVGLFSIPLARRFAEVTAVESGTGAVRDLRWNAEQAGVALTAILCSPDFLYLELTPGRLNDFELASRLSYFLWSTMPDATLFDLAKRGELGSAEAIHKQVDRMLNHPKARAFTESFTGQ